MTPDQAISKMAFEAVDLLEEYRAQGGSGQPTQMMNCLSAATRALALVSGIYRAETAHPGSIANMTDAEREFVLREAHAAATGVLLVCSLLPGVDALPELVTQ